MNPARATIAALSANLVAIGIARFGYTPLIPALIAAGWFRPSAAVYLGAANLAGYLAGAIAAPRAGRVLGAAATLRGAMVLTVASLVACAFPLGFAWYFVWRFVSGMTGGAAMALAAPTVLAHLSPERRAIAGGVVFTGVGLGIAASGTLVPALVSWGVREAWLGFAALAAVLTAITWRDWPREAPPAAPAHSPQPSGPLRALYLEYALNAAGQVPHMVFLVDFIARGLGRGLGAGGRYWIVFGVGALIGPLVGGHLGGRFGFRRVLRACFVWQGACVALLLVATSGPALMVSSFVVGASVPGTVAIVIGRTHEIVPHDPARQAAAWSYCTLAFAIGQAIAGYAYSYIFAHSTDGYPTIFALGASAMLAGLAVDFAATPPWRP
ncbi:MAG TPA: YbfB/YjiJ family MFS transporter [Stellaceae bacterium]|jgi:predicted MFS family arabinose efflux permease|nr:YbfB/YjiJ family MFS transporter [Stellaceae bacterium]